MWFRFPLPLLVATVVSAVLAVTMHAQQVPNPVLPGPSGTGDGLLTRDALEAPEAPKPTAVSATPPRRSTAHHHGTPHRASSAGRTATYATISHHRHHHRAKSHTGTMVAANRSTIQAKKPARPRAPLVSFIYWWNGWVVRTFHTRSGTVLLDTIGAKT